MSYPKKALLENAAKVKEWPSYLRIYTSAYVKRAGIRVTGAR